MKCMPRSWDLLPQSEKNKINKIMTEWAYDRVDQEEAEMQEVWIKLCCILLHDFHDFTEEELLQFIAGWKRMYRRNDRTENKEKQTAWLKKEMARCFPTCGFPQIRIDELKNGSDKR